jgi:TolB protein
MVRGSTLCALLLVLWPALAAAQWTNRYPKVQGYSHHVYLEGYELPLFTVGPVDAAARGDLVAFASQGWLWTLGPETRSARRLTRAAGIDSRPAWSPDGALLAFVRDDTRETSIVQIDVATGQERVLVEETGIDLDPAYAPDGRSLYYASAVAGDLDLWRLDLASGESERVTMEAGLERRPIPHPDGDRLVYLSKSRGGGDQVRVRTLSTGEERTIYEGSILSQLQPALSPDGRTIALNVPDQQGGWELRAVDLEQPGPAIALVSGRGLPLAPAWSDDGRWVYFSEAGPDERMHLMRVPAVGGVTESVQVDVWDWGEETGRLRIRTRVEGTQVPARLAILDGRGHPAVPTGGKPFFDGQNGRVFFYGDGFVELELPVGEVVIDAVRGLATPMVSTAASVEAGRITEVDLELTSVWSAADDGWMSGDHHFHLNYGGAYQLDPEDLVLFARGEDLDVATPLLANLHNRFEQQELWGADRLGPLPWIQFGQEVRSHFLGHVSLLNTRDLFWPWIWGPGYQVYGTDDRTNAEALSHARAQGGMNTYVHPVGNPDPFGTDPPAGIPVAFIADAVQGHVDGLEVACLWSNERGTTELWYRLLNVGVPIAPTAGTDVMTDFYRTMAVGATRVYVQTGGSTAFSDYMEALRAGRSFVTTGPLLDFHVRDVGPGGALHGSGRAEWTLDLHTAVPTERVEVVVNGRVVWSDDAPAGPGSRAYSGTVELPSGGWVAARATGPAIVSWPGMSTDAFAHTAPVWIGSVGSTEDVARRTAAEDLLRGLAGARRRLEAAYAGAEIPVLEGHFDRARSVLEELAR